MVGDWDALQVGWEALVGVFAVTCLVQGNREMYPDPPKSAVGKWEAASLMTDVMECLFGSQSLLAWHRVLAIDVTDCLLERLDGRRDSE